MYIEFFYRMRRGAKRNATTSKTGATRSINHIIFVVYVSYIRDPEQAKKDLLEIHK